ncbi:hypothetical protein JCM5296_003861, partial [Sporobolomyces johnsonii]
MDAAAPPQFPSLPSFRSTSPLSDPARAWMSNNPFASLALSDAGSSRSEGSAARRAEAAAQAEEDRRLRWEAFEANEARLARELEEELELADLESAAVKEEFVPEREVSSHKSALEAEEDVVRRSMAELDERRARLQRILDAKAGVRVGDGAAPLTVVSADADVPLAEVSLKLKITPPPSWKGEYDHAKRESWIKTLRGYCAAIGLDIQARLSESDTPTPFFTIRSLFSSESVNGFSAVAWFDARNDRSPFLSVQQVIDAVRAHWKDDTAAETALQVYRTARQGSSRARDFGSRLETLADAVFDRQIDDADRVSTFVVGLNANYREYLKTQMALLRTLGKAPTTLREVVDLAAVADGLDSFTTSLKRSGGVPSSTSSPSPKKSSPGTHASPTSASTGVSASSAGSSLEARTTRWRANAENWQAAHPLATKSAWGRDGDHKPAQ